MSTGTFVSQSTAHTSESTRFDLLALRRLRRGVVLLEGALGSRDVQSALAQPGLVLLALPAKFRCNESALVKHLNDREPRCFFFLNEAQPPEMSSLPQRHPFPT